MPTRREQANNHIFDNRRITCQGPDADIAGDLEARSVQKAGSSARFRKQAPHRNSLIALGMRLQTPPPCRDFGILARAWDRKAR
jgi:hypothetical protein